MASNITPNDNRTCPIYNKVIDGELCYETAMCMQGFFKIASVPESKDIKLDLDEAKKICVNCPYSDME